MHRDKLGQIDVYGVEFSGRVLLGECYLGKNPPTEKVNQLLKFDDLFQNNIKVLFYLSDESDELVRLSKEKGVYLIPLNILREIRKMTKITSFLSCFFSFSYFYGF